MKENFERMIALVTEVFDVRNDPDQIEVNEQQREKLFSLHPATMSERSNEDGPIAWILMIPTTTSLMNQFIEGIISEKKLLDETNPGDKFSAIYLCSASVLPEFRRQGIGLELCLNAIRNIMETQPITALFFWEFSEGGAGLAQALGEKLSLPVYKRVHT